MTYPTTGSARGETMRRFDLVTMDKRPDGSDAEDTATVGPFERSIANGYADILAGKMLAAPVVPGTMRCWRVRMEDRNPAFGDEAVVERFSKSGFLPMAEANAWFAEVFEADKAVPGWGGSR